MKITRWNPTANGALHIGHIYSLLVNEHFAHDSGGKFYVRFDDTSQAITAEMEHPERVSDIIRGQIDDIEWLRFSVDDWIYQSDMLEEVHKKMSKYKAHIVADLDIPFYIPQVISKGNTYICYPYVPGETAERVIMDNMLGITHVIRGDEFLTEYSLYNYFCDIFNMRHPKFSFLPRLVDKNGKDISKTNGGYTIKELRGDGYTAEEIIKVLERACLTRPGRSWSLYNLRTEPRLDI